MPAPIKLPRKHDVNHTLFEDIQGLFLGCSMASIGFICLAHLGLITGQSAGAALIISYIFNISFGAVFFVINIPFYIFAYFRLGLSFTIKSLLCIAFVSIAAEYLPQFIQFEELNPIVGILIFGINVGLGLLACIRHEGSLGGISVIALIIQDKTNFKAGWFQLIVDFIIFTIAVFFFPLSIILYSFLGSCILNLVLAMNHRRDRYIAR